MAERPQFFTVEQANALRPRLEVELGDLARLRSELGATIEELGGLEQAMGILQRGESSSSLDQAAAERLKRVAGEIARAVERIQGLGCVLKDLDQGLIDFYALRDDEPVFLCWQLGEPAVSHWHPLDEGFAGRRPLEEVEVEPPRFVN